ncbi:MAG: tryptophan synthase subunit alpha [Candidatus Altiarchaeota archaeon]
MRLEEKFSELEKKGEKGLIGFVVAGDPGFEESFETACSVIEAGVDVLEIGLPFSDPIADGPTIQAAGKRALDAGMNTDRYFELAGRISGEYDVPLVCLTYYNLVLQYGLGRFAESCSRTGVGGIIIPDLPVEEAGPLLRECRRSGVEFIFLVAETTTDERMSRILEEASGFVYIVALLGTTGARESLSAKLKPLVARIRRMTSLPLAVGFGISKPEHVREVLSYGADAAIVGSAIVKLVEEGKDVSDYVKSLKKETRG